MKTEIKEQPVKKLSREIKREVVLLGLTPILFDRYSGNNKEQLSVMDKVYQRNGFLVLPSTNILSFLSAQNTESAPQRVVGRGWKEVAKAAQSYVTVTPYDIPFFRNDKQIESDDKSITVHMAVARIVKGKLAVPNPKERPMLDLPWELRFSISLYETPELNEVLLRRLFEIGGKAIGLGTFRGVFGKFLVDSWE